MSRSTRRLVAPLAGLAALSGSALLLGACGYTGTPAQQMRSWASQNAFATNEQQVLSDISSVELAARKGSALQLRTVCGGLSSDAGTVYSSLPTPDHAITNQLGASMQDFYNAAESCAVVSSTRSAAVTHDLARIHAGLVILADVRRRLLADGVRSPVVPSS